MCGTVPRQVRWENRFHVGVSGHNHGLHPVHRDFFSAPQPFDMLTKPRRPLAKEPIVARLTRTRAQAPAPVEIAPKHGPPPRPAPVPAVGAPTVSPLARALARPGPHAPSFLAPFALAKPASGPRQLHVPASFELFDGTVVVSRPGMGSKWEARSGKRYGPGNRSQP